MLLFSTFAVYAEPVELVENTIDTSITEVDSTIVDSVVVPFAMIDTELLLMTEVPMRTNHTSLVEKRSNSLLYSKIERLNYRDGPTDFPGINRYFTHLSIPTKQDTGAKALRRSPFTGFKRHNTAS